MRGVFILSGGVRGISRCFRGILKKGVGSFSMRGLSSASSFGLCSARCLNIMASISSRDSRDRVLGSYLVLRSFGVFVLLGVVVSCSVRRGLGRVVSGRVCTRRRLCPMRTPVVALGMVSGLGGACACLECGRTVSFGLRALGICRSQGVGGGKQLLGVLLCVLTVVKDTRALRILRARFKVPFGVSF